MSMKRGRLDMTEREFRQLLQDLAVVLKWQYYFAVVPWRSPPGWPDMFFIRGRHVVAAELKSEKGKMTLEQAKWLGLLDGAGIPAFLWRPSQFDAIVEYLRDPSTAAEIPSVWTVWRSFPDSQHSS